MTAVTTQAVQTPPNTSIAYPANATPASPKRRFQGANRQAFTVPTRYTWAGGHAHTNTEHKQKLRHAMGGCVGLFGGVCMRTLGLGCLWGACQENADCAKTVHSRRFSLYFWDRVGG